MKLKLFFIMNSILLFFMSNNSLAIDKIEIVPKNVVLHLGATYTFTITAYSGNNTVSTSFVWKGGNLGTVSLIGSKLLYRAMSVGTDSIVIHPSNITTVSSTITVVNISPAIMKVEIVPSSIQLVAGETRKITPYIYYTTGLVVPLATASYVSILGKVSETGTYTAIKAGNDQVIITIGTKKYIVNVQINPGPLYEIVPIVKKPLYVGKEYRISEVIKGVGSDQFGNVVPLSTVTYTFKKTDGGRIKKYLSTLEGFSDIQKILEEGCIRRGDEILFFEDGTYTIHMKSNGKEKMINYVVTFKDLERVELFQIEIEKISFEDGVIAGIMKISDYQPQPFRIHLSPYEVKLLRSRHYWDKAKVVADVYAVLVDKYQSFMAEQNWRRFEEEVLKVIAEKNVKVPGTITASTLFLLAGTLTVEIIGDKGTFTFDNELYKGYFHINYLERIKYGTYPYRFCKFSGIGTYRKINYYRFDIKIKQTNESSGEVEIIVYTPYGKRVGKYWDYYRGVLNMNIDGVELKEIIRVRGSGSIKRSSFHIDVEMVNKVVKSWGISLINTGRDTNRNFDFYSVSGKNQISHFSVTDNLIYIKGDGEVNYRISFPPFAPFFTPIVMPGRAPFEIYIFLKDSRMKFIIQQHVIEGKYKGNIEVRRGDKNGR